MGTEANFDENFFLELDLSKPNCQQLLSLFAKCEVRLPNIRRIWIRTVKTEADEDLSKFFSHCFPLQLQLFDFNYYVINLVYWKQYRQGLEMVLPRDTKEVYIYYCKLDTQDLEVGYILTSHPIP